ncbi:Cullin-associated NEDD8-dissociated protein 1, C-terminal part [Venturia inaequalis]|nr:Cullin-associated NEDD8-dissociated protein 1, C-terminal part [Venturia inaequalis]
MILYPDVYSFTQLTISNDSLIDHCLDYLRQYVQCNADLTPMYFENVDHAGLLLKVETKHTCARFDQIQQWVETKRTTEAPPGFG